MASRCRGSGHSSKPHRFPVCWWFGLEHEGGYSGEGDRGDEPAQRPEQHRFYRADWSHDVLSSGATQRTKTTRTVNAPFLFGPGRPAGDCGDGVGDVVEDAFHHVIREAPFSEDRVALRDPRRAVTVEPMVSG